MDDERMARRVKTNKRIMLIGGLLVLAVVVAIIVATIADGPPEHEVVNAPDGGAAVSVEIPGAYSEGEYMELAEHLRDEYGDRTVLFFCDVDADPAANVTEEDGELVVRTYHDEDAACG